MDAFEPTVPKYLLWATALEQLHTRMKDQPPDMRDGLHVSDVVGDQGWRCPRYLQFVLSSATRQASDDLRFRLRRFEIGTAFHDWTYRHARPAAELYAQTYGLKLRKVLIEHEISDPVSGVVGTPDLIVVYETPKGQLFVQVVDVKSVDAGTLRRMTSKRTGKLLPPTRNRMQVQIYSAILKATARGLLYVETFEPYRRTDVPLDDNPALLAVIRTRVAGARAALDAGVWLRKLTQASYCKSCPFQEQCRGVEGEGPAEGYDAPDAQPEPESVEEDA